MNGYDPKANLSFHDRITTMDLFLGYASHFHIGGVPSIVFWDGFSRFCFAEYPVTLDRVFTTHERSLALNYVC